MRELEFMQEKLKFHEKLAEKELVSSSANVLDNLTDKVKDLAFDMGTNLTMQIISSIRKKRKSAGGDSTNE